MRRFWLIILPVGLMALVVVISVKRLPVQEPQQIKTEVAPTPMVESIQVNEVKSGDGLMRLIRTSRKLASGDSDYAIKLDNRIIFETTLPKGSSVEIPLNSWSPDDKQLFIEEKNGRTSDFLVFKADGSLYGDGQKSLSVADYWARTKYSLWIKTVTGWAGNDLLVVYTLKEDGTDGPAFWFVTSTRKFMQLRQI